MRKYGSRDGKLKSKYYHTQFWYNEEKKGHVYEVAIKLMKLYD